MFNSWNDLRYGARILRRSPAFSAMVIAVIALGIGANSTIFSVVNAVLLRPLPYHEPDGLFQLQEVNPQGEPTYVPYADLAAFGSRVFEKAGFSHWQNVTLTGPEGPENVFGGRLSVDTLPMLGVRPALGRLFDKNEFKPGAPDVALISDHLWQQRFARSPMVLGRPIMLNGKAHTVIGVMPPEFFFARLRFELWTPLQVTGDIAGDRTRFPVVVRLRSGLTPQQAQADLQGMFRNAAPEQARKGWRVRLTPLATLMTERVRPALLVLLGAVGFVLLIACLNVANLLLARGSSRSREIAIRAALGAGRMRIIKQLLTENLVLAGLGGAAGLALAGWGSRTLITLLPERIPVPRLEQARMDSTVLLFTIVLTLLTGLAFGIIPALQASRGGAGRGLKEGGRGATGGRPSRRLRNSLVVAETALSLVLLAGAGLMVRSFDRLTRVDPGFRADQVLTLRVPCPTAIAKRPEQAAYYERVLERIQALPGLNAAGLITPLPLSDVEANGTFAAEGRPAARGEQQLVSLRAVSPGYFRAMGIAVRVGRVLGEGDGAGAPQVAVVNEALARRYFPNENPVGKRISMSSNPKADEWITVIGVVNNVRSLSLGGEAGPEMYRDFRQFFFAPFATTLALRTGHGDPMRLAAAAQREIRRINPDQPITELKTMRQVVALNVAQPRFYTVMLGLFAAIALVLAAAGLYGVLSYSVSQRAQEIGIRMALGAPREAIFRQVVGHALGLVAAGVALGLAGAFALTRLIASQLYQTEPTDPLTLASVSLLLLAVGAAASYLPARRAVGIDPISALRCE
jgi:putative ABC transport system permease protein